MAAHTEYAGSLTSHTSLTTIGLIGLALLLLTIATCAGYNAAQIRSSQAAFGTSFHTTANDK